MPLLNKANGKILRGLACLIAFVIHKQENPSKSFDCLGLGGFFNVRLKKPCSPRQ